MLKYFHNGKWTASVLTLPPPSHYSLMPQPWDISIICPYTQGNTRMLTRSHPDGQCLCHGSYKMHWISPLGTCHAKMPFRKIILSQGRAIWVTSSQIENVFFHPTELWQKGLVDTVKGFKYSALTVALYLFFSRYQKKKIGMVPLLLHLPRDRKLWILITTKKCIGSGIRSYSLKHEWFIQQILYKYKYFYWSRDD